MFIKQISVFAENRTGAISEITEVLLQSQVNIRALCIADTSDFGVVRLIVDKMDEALAALRSKGMTVVETDVIAVSVADQPGGFHGALLALGRGGAFVEYAYAFVAPRSGEATVILRCREQEDAARQLLAAGYRLLSQSDVSC